jgi:PII-like signaling protein
MSQLSSDASHPHAADARGERVLLRVYLLSTDQAHLSPAYEHIVMRAAKHHLAGGTVLRGIYGFGSRGIHEEPSAWHRALPVPVIIEIVDAADRIAAFIREEVEKVLTHGLLTLERAGVIFHRTRGGPAQNAMQILGSVNELSTVPQIQGSAAMKTNEDGILLRVFAGESDRVADVPLYKAIIEKARELGLAGATVLRGSMGFGAHSRVHTAKVLELSSDLPIVIELVDTRANIEKLLPHLDTMVGEGMITMESVRVLAYRHGGANAAD